MEIEARIEKSRGERRRRERMAGVAMSAAVVLTIGVMVVFGRFGTGDRSSPVFGLAVALMAATIVGANRWAHRGDEWYRRHTLRVSAVALGAVVAWLVGESLWLLLVDAAYVPSPAKALDCGALAALVAHVGLRRDEDGE